MADKGYIIKTYKYRLYPTQEQVEQIEQMFAAIRWVYNAALEQRRWYGRKQGTDVFYRDTRFSAYSQAKELVYADQKDGRIGLKNIPELSWITCVPAKSLGVALADLDKAFDRFYKEKGKVGYPSPRKYTDNNSVTSAVFNKQKNGFYMNVVFGKNTVKFPRVGRIKYKRHMNFSGEGRTATIIREASEYYICLTTRIQKRQYERPDTYIGIDLGVAKPVMTSNGEFLDPVENLKVYDSKYRKLQKKFARQVKTSNRRKKTKEVLGRIKKKEARCRKNSTHRATTAIVKKYTFISIEDLKVSNMVKSAKGDMENPGRNVAPKSGLNRSILNVAPYMFRNQLEYKSKWYGSFMESVDPKYTSQTCSQCGSINKESRKSQSQYECQTCGSRMNADHNAAINILHKAEFSGATSSPRKTPSEIRRNSATSQSIVSAIAPLINHSKRSLSQQVSRFHVFDLK